MHSLLVCSLLQDVLLSASDIGHSHPELAQYLEGTIRRGRELENQVPVEAHLLTTPRLKAGGTPVLIDGPPVRLRGR
jgi:hypothetical protein